MSTNPYAENDLKSPYAFQSQIPSSLGDGYVKQVPVIGILSIVQASLELLVCLTLVAMSAFMIAMQNSPQLQKTPNAPSVFWMAILYGVLAAVIGIAAVLRLASGILLLKKKGRVFSIVVSVIGLASVFTCYCAPTSLALAIYSLVVLIQPSVMEAFNPSLSRSAPS